MRKSLESRLPRIYEGIRLESPGQKNKNIVFYVRLMDDLIGDFLQRADALEDVTLVLVSNAGYKRCHRVRSYIKKELGLEDPIYFLDSQSSSKESLVNRALLGFSGESYFVDDRLEEVRAVGNIPNEKLISRIYSPEHTDVWPDILLDIESQCFY
ncbi:MAG: hypothetical protein Q9M91_08155 [Candidatus Dojkabacteria bacterium]|nr:hypothetical protein [Candidatus Dojkabacteria bacterium]